MAWLVSWKVGQMNTTRPAGLLEIAPCYRYELVKRDEKDSISMSTKLEPANGKLSCARPS
jgi:hypothetical protein